jgi:hypothetical protein
MLLFLGLGSLKLLFITVPIAIRAIVIKVGASPPKLAEKENGNDGKEDADDGTECGPKDAEEPEEGLEDVVNGDVHIVRWLSLSRFQFGTERRN